MKVVHLATGFIPVSSTSSRSVEKSLYHLATNQAQLGCAVDVVDIKAGSRPRGNTKVQFHKLWTLRLPGSNLLIYFFKVIFFTLRLLPTLHRLLKNGGVDIIHTHSQFPAAVALLGRRLFGWKIPVVYTAHNPYLMMPPSLANRLKHLLIEDKVLTGVDLVIAQTEAVGKELSLRFNVEPTKIAQIFAGVDIKAINDFIEHHPYQEHSHKVILYPAIINPRKNQMAVIESIPTVLKVRPDCMFVLAGAIDDATYYDTAQKFVLEHGLSSYVEFTGELSIDLLYGLYRNATIFVFPTLYESQGVVLVEAMAFSLPVIASKIGPIMDVVSLEKGSALLIDPYNTDEIATTIIKLLQDENLRNEMAAKGRKLALSRFPWSQIAQATLTVYQECIERSRTDNL